MALSERVSNQVDRKWRPALEAAIGWRRATPRSPELDEACRDGASHHRADSIVVGVVHPGKADHEPVGAA